jgi:hypothetical protein
MPAGKRKRASRFIQAFSVVDALLKSISEKYFYFIKKTS